MPTQPHRIPYPRRTVGSLTLSQSRISLRDKNRIIRHLTADAANSAGTNALLKQGARPVTCGWDVLADYERLFPGRLRPGRANLPEESAPAPVEKVRPVPGKEKKEIDKEKTKGYIDLRDQLSGLSAEQLEIITAIGKGRQHIDDIIDATGYPAAKVLAQLTVLEIKGFISRSAGKRISLNIKR